MKFLFLAKILLLRKLERNRQENIQLDITKQS